MTSKVESDVVEESFHRLQHRALMEETTSYTVADLVGSSSGSDSHQREDNNQRADQKKKQAQKEKKAKALRSTNPAAGGGAGAASYEVKPKPDGGGDETSNTKGLRSNDNHYQEVLVGGSDASYKVKPKSGVGGGNETSNETTTSRVKGLRSIDETTDTSTHNNNQIGINIVGGDQSGVGEFPYYGTLHT